jgi:hypothetical protein
MATNEILPFASTNTGTNLLTQAEYTADAQRVIGHQPGIARSKLENKALRQASLMSAGLAEFIADYQANNVTDSLTSQNVADYLYAAIQAALAVTPPQFDNDTSLATSEFVRTASQQYRAEKFYSANTTLTAADIGCYVTITNGATLTLPANGSMPVGQSMTFTNGATLTCFLNVPSGGSFYPPGTGSTQIRLEQYDTVEVVTYGSNNYLILKGSAQSGRQWRYRTQFGASGYSWMPNGMLVQWGQFSGTSFNPSITYYPISFPNAVWTVLTQNTSGFGIGPYLNYAITNSYFNWELFSNAGTPVSGATSMRWLAIGY